MKEGLRQLANPSQTPYSKGEEIFMGAEPGGGENMPQEGGQLFVDKPKQPNQPKMYKENTQWVSLNNEPYEDWEKLSFEETQTAEAMLKKGLPLKVAGGAPTPFDNTAFTLEADQLKNILTRQDFKNYIDLAKITLAQDMPQFWKQFGEFSKNLHNNLYGEYARLTDAPVDKIRKTGLETEMRTLDAEEKSVYELMEKKVPAEAKSASQEQQKLVNEVKKGKEELGVATTQVAKDRANEKIKEAANDLFEMILGGERPPEDSPVPDEIMEAIGADEVATEKFIHRLIFLPIENESYHMSGFYSESNKVKFLKVNNPEVIGKERYERLQALLDANEKFHSMNYVLKRSFDQFSQLAQSLHPEQFQVIANIPGVGAVFHLYERFSQEHLGVETRIANNEFDKMDSEVEEIFKEMNGENVMPGMEGSSLKDWEVLRALVYGRNMFRISVRAAEHVSHSELPGRLPGLGMLPADSEIFISPPQKELVGILNFIKYTAYRFKPNEELGGFELIDTVREERMKKRRRDGKMRIKTFQGTDVDMRNLETIVAARGLMYTWRMRDALLKEIKFKDGDKTTSITDFFAAHKNEIATISSEEEATRLFKPMLDGNQLALGVLISSWAENVPPQLKTLIWRKIASLNPLVMSSILTRLEIDRYDRQKAKGAEDLNGVQSMEEILLEKWGTDEQRQKLGGGRFQLLRAELRDLNEALEKKQKKIKDMEHPFAVDIPKNKEKLDKLRGTGKYKDKGNPRYKTLKEEIGEISKQYDQKKIEYGQTDEAIRELLRNERWEAMKKKLTKAHEKRILWESTHMGETPRSLDAYLVGDIVLNHDEQDVYRKIQANGERIASDLANFSQATTWFMDDVPLPVIKWSNLGQTYDRMVNDLAAFQKSNEGLGKVIAGRPFNDPPTEIAKHFGEAIAAAASVVGRAGTAQDNYFDLIDQYLKMIEERPKYRTLPISEYKHMRLEPTSRGQEITGSMQSPATNEEGTFDVVRHFLDQSCLRGTIKTVTDNKDDNGKITYESQVKDIIKKHHIGFWDRVVKKNIRDFGPLGIIAFLIVFFKKTFSDINKI